MEKVIIDVSKLISDGWYLTRQVTNNRGLAAIETKPLTAIKQEELPVAEAQEQKGVPEFDWPTAVREQDEDGKWFCRNCHKKITGKPNFCPNCGHKFVDEGAQNG